MVDNDIKGQLQHFTYGSIEGEINKYHQDMRNSLRANTVVKHTRKEIGKFKLLAGTADGQLLHSDEQNIVKKFIK